MQISLEISLYPLKDEYKPSIIEFIAHLEAQENVSVFPNRMSTQIVGDVDVIMPLLQSEMMRSWQESGPAVFVCKFLPGDRSPEQG